MFLTGERIACITGARGAQIQPAGVDLRVDKVFKFTGRGQILVDGKKTAPVEEIPTDNNGSWILEPGAYKIRFLDPVRVPTWAVGFCYPRSSLLRSGVTVECAVWDPGYYGRGEALLIVANPHGFLLERGARVAQLVYAVLEGRAQGYKGSYQGENL